MHGAKQNMKLVPISCQTKLSISDVIKILLIILGEGSLKKKDTTSNNYNMKEG